MRTSLQLEASLIGILVLRFKTATVNAGTNNLVTPAKAGAYG